MATAKFEALRTEEPPSADHEKRTRHHQPAPENCLPPKLYSLTLGKVHHGSEDPSGGGNRHADKIFFAWPARIRRLRIHLNIESGQAARAGHEKHETRGHSDVH